MSSGRAGGGNCLKKKYVNDKRFKTFTMQQHEKAVKGMQLVVSFYALGEFTNDTKRQYIDNVLAKVPAAYLIWNSHSGADDSCIADIQYYHQIRILPEVPLTHPNNIVIQYP